MELGGFNLNRRRSYVFYNRAQAIKWGLQLLDILVQAHELDIAHRDIKPGNILVTNDGKFDVLLVDWNSCKLCNVKEYSSLSYYLTTSEFRSPEAWEKKEVCAEKSDVWSVGVVLVEMISHGEFIERESADNTRIQPYDAQARIKTALRWSRNQRNLWPVVEPLLDMNPRTRASALDAYEHLNRYLSEMEEEPIVRSHEEN